MVHDIGRFEELAVPFGVARMHCDAALHLHRIYVKDKELWYRENEGESPREEDGEQGSADVPVVEATYGRITVEGHQYQRESRGVHGKDLFMH